MNCLLVTNIFAPINGGSAIVYEMLCRYSPNNSVVVLAPKKNYSTNEDLKDWEKIDEKAEFPIHRLSLLRPREMRSRSIFESAFLYLFVDLPLRLKVFLYTSWLIRKYDIDVICIGELTSMSWLGQACKYIHRTKVVNYIHGEEVTAEFSFRNFGKRRDHYLRNADGIVAVSNFTREYLINRFNLPDEKIRLIQNGVDLKRFCPAEKPSKLVDRYQLHGKTVLATVGRLIPRKGIDQTILSLHRILEADSTIHYLVVGTGPFEAELKNLVADNELQAYVTFTGRVPEEELADHYRLCDIFVMANRTMPDGDTEGFGLVFLEANACGKAVIGGIAGGAVEAVKDGHSGLQVNGLNPREIADSIIYLLENPEIRKGIESNGLEYAQGLDFKRCAELFHAFCKEVLEN